MSEPAVGFTLQPEQKFLDLVDELVRCDVDYYEVAPETTWWADDAERLHANGFHRRFAALGAATGNFFVAHGVGLSMGTTAAADAPRRRRWLSRVRLDQATFGYRWYSDHLGATSLDGEAMTLPLPLPMTSRSAQVVRRRLRSMQQVVGDVAVENNVGYFMLGDPLDEPAFLDAILAAPRTHLVLDLHNVFTMAVNFHFDAAAYLDRLDLGKVIEIHLSGGSESEGRWLPSGRVLRLDSHDHAIPDEVWRLAERIVPRCPRLRGVTLERMEGTVEPADVPELREEVRRIRHLTKRR